MKMRSAWRRALGRRIAFLAGLAAFVPLAAPGAGAGETAPFYLRDGDRVVFYGDSITEQSFWGAGAYADFTETYVLTRFPGMRIDFTNSGWGGDAVSWSGGGTIDQRVQRDIIAHEPTVVTIMLGMNDGKYQPMDPEVFRTYRDGYRRIVDAIRRELPNVRLTMIKPSPYDDITRAPNFEGGYNAVLRSYGRFVGELAAEDGEAVADFNAPVTAVLREAERRDPPLAAKIINDRVHPGPGAHLVMAEALLRSWNAPALVTDVEIDAGKGVVRAAGTRITGLRTDGGLAWTQADDALPMPVDLADPATALAVGCSDFFDALDREPLRITGLAAAAYSLKIDGAVVGAFSRDQLASGINLATLPTPMARQAAEVHKLTEKRNHFHFVGWHWIGVALVQQGTTDAIDKAVPPLLRAIDAEEAAIVDQQREAAQPVPHRYELSAQ
jgi:lysophospholipase L1-like esterase